MLFSVCLIDHQDVCDVGIVMPEFAVPCEIFLRKASPPRTRSLNASCLSMVYGVWAITIPSALKVIGSRKNLICSQTCSDTFRTSCGSALEILNRFLDFRDLIDSISKITKFSKDDRSDRGCLSISLPPPTRSSTLPDSKPPQNLEDPRHRVESSERGFDFIDS
jgi:hypothetical protein